MKIEVVEFYPISRKGNNFKGTLHVYLIDTDQDIRGIFLKKTGNIWWFEIPYRIQYDKETKKEVRFPVISFTDHKKQKALMDMIRAQGRSYIEKNFLFKGR